MRTHSRDAPHARAAVQDLLRQEGYHVFPSLITFGDLPEGGTDRGPVPLMAPFAVAFAHQYFPFGGEVNAVSMKTGAGRQVLQPDLNGFGGNALSESAVFSISDRCRVIKGIAVKSTVGHPQFYFGHSIAGLHQGVPAGGSTVIVPHDKPQVVFAGLVKGDRCPWAASERIPLQVLPAVR